MFALVLLLILRVAEAQITTDAMDLNFGYTPTHSPYHVEDSHPVITLHLSDITAPQGGAVHFSCSATGSPKPIIQLTPRTSSIIPEIDNTVESVLGLGGSVSADLTLKKISLSDGGWYRCIAFNSGGYAYSDAYLTVRDICDDVTCPGARSCVPDYADLTTSCECVKKCDGVVNAYPVCGSDCKIHYSLCHWNLAACQNDYPLNILSYGTFCPDTSPPKIEISSGPFEVFEGDVLILEVVKVEGSPAPIMTWYRGEEVIGEGMTLTILASTPAHSGKYYSKAVNCGNVTGVSESVDVLVKIKLPPEGTKVCNVFGDPHVSTFDGLAYKVGGKCYYVLAMECHAMDWIVYGYFTSCGAGSCLEAVSLFHGHESVILERGWVIRYRGERQSYDEESFKIGSFDFNFDGMYLIVKCVDVGLTVVWDGCTGLQISLSGDEYKDTTTCGICGNNDGVKDNELAQLRSIGEGDGSIEGFVHSWTVDRNNMCTATTHVAMSELQPCGSANFIENEASKKACQALLDSSLLQSCWDDVNVKEYYKACLVDTCSIDLLTEEYPVVCAVASAYIKTCELKKGASLQGDWRTEIGCPVSITTKEAIMAFGVEG